MGLITCDDEGCCEWGLSPVMMRDAAEGVTLAAPLATRPPPAWLAPLLSPSSSAPRHELPPPPPPPPPSPVVLLHSQQGRRRTHAFQIQRRWVFFTPFNYFI